MHRIGTKTIATVVASLVLAAPAYAQTQTVDDIAARHVASRGGPEKWQSIQTQRTTGTIYTQGIELTMVMVNKRPNLGRQDLTLDIPGQGPVAIVNVFDGKTAWTINPMLGGLTATDVSGRDAENMRDQSELDSPLIDYKRKGHTVELVGVETVGDRKAHRLKVTRPGRTGADYFVDVETGVELRIAADGEGAPVVEFSDHRPVDGILVPYLIRILQSGQAQADIVVTSVEFNVPVDDAMFRRP